MLSCRLIPVAILLSGNLFSWVPDKYQPLFVLEKSTNGNVVHYDARISPDGELDAREPVVVYWIMSDGRRQDLTLLERLKVYGISVRRRNRNSFQVALTSFRERVIDVYREGDVVRARTTIGGRAAYLAKIYVTVSKPSPWSGAKSIELIGTDTITGDQVHETILPGE
jgi:Domain of unknown function (DUF4833)